MREILFRGKRSDNGKWVYGYYVHVPCGRFEREEHLIQEIKNNGKFGALQRVDPTTIGQYTGLTDKNGQRIFEGDIIKIEHDDYAFDGMSLEYRTDQGMVAYDEVGAIGIVVERYKGANVWSDFFHVLGLTDRIANWTFEILGNIHDNPELLEGGDEGE